MKKICDAIRRLFRRKRWSFGSNMYTKFNPYQERPLNGGMNDEDFKEKMKRLFHMEVTEHGVHLEKDLYVDGVISATGKTTP